jgi:hypothetical protein
VLRRGARNSRRLRRNVQPERRAPAFLRKLADANAPPDLEQHEDPSGQYDREDGSSQDNVHVEGDLRLAESQRRPNFPRTERVFAGSPSRLARWTAAGSLKVGSTTGQTFITLFLMVFRVIRSCNTSYRTILRGALQQKLIHRGPAQEAGCFPHFAPPAEDTIDFLHRPVQMKCQQKKRFEWQ